VIGPVACSDRAQEVLVALAGTHLADGHSHRAHLLQEVGVQALPDGARTGAHLSCKRREGNEGEDAEEKEEEEEEEEAREEGKKGRARRKVREEMW
jgi:hypothetical protein